MNFLAKLAIFFNTIHHISSLPIISVNCGTFAKCVKFQVLEAQNPITRSSYNLVSDVSNDTLEFLVVSNFNNSPLVPEKYICSCSETKNDEEKLLLEPIFGIIFKLITSKSASNHKVDGHSDCGSTPFSITHHELSFLNRAPQDHLDHHIAQENFNGTFTSHIQLQTLHLSHEETMMSMIEVTLISSGRGPNGIDSPLIFLELKSEEVSTNFLAFA